MALYIGEDLIAVCGLSKGQVRRIVDTYSMRKIGELRLATGFYDVKGLKKEGNVWHLDPLLSNDFDGWVYPDGSQYFCADFPAASAVYAVSPEATSFCVPDLRGKFFKGHVQNQLVRDPSTGTTYDLLEEVPKYNKTLKAHNHGIADPKIGIETQLTILSGFVFCAAGNAGTANRTKIYKTIDNKPFTVPCLHSGNCTFKDSYVPLPLDMTLKIGDLSAFFGQDAQTGPAYNSDIQIIDNPDLNPAYSTLPTMIYIGMTTSTRQAEKTFPVMFIDGLNNNVFEVQYVVKGGDAHYPTTYPVHDNWLPVGWDSTPITNIQAPTEVKLNYQRNKFTVTLHCKVQDLLPRYLNSSLQPAAGMISAVVKPAEGAQYTKTLHTNAAFGSISELVIEDVPSETKVEIIATVDSGNQGVFKTWKGSMTSSSSVLTIPSVVTNTEITAEFGNAMQHIGWKLQWNLEDNCDAEENRIHVQDNIAVYKYMPNTLLDNTGTVMSTAVYERVTNTVDSTLPKNNREYIKLLKVSEDPNGFGVNQELQQDTAVEEDDYGLFLLDTRSQENLPEAYFANCIDDTQYFGMAFNAIDDQGNNIVFVSPKSNASGIQIHGWEFPKDVQVTSIDSNGRIKLGTQYAPAIRPVTSKVGATKVQLKTSADGTAEVKLATIEQYIAFWGSANPVFL